MILWGPWQTYDGCHFFRTGVGNSTNLDPDEVPGEAGTDDTTVPPAVTEPPAIERVVITQRTVSIARGLVEQALGESDGSETA